MKFVVMLRQEMLAELITNTMLLPLLLLISHLDAHIHALEHQCIHDTDEMQTLMYGPVVDAKTGLRYGFTPQGINESTNQQMYRSEPPPDAPDEVHRAFHATAFGNLRIVTSNLDLNDPTKYCTTANDIVPNFLGGNVSCTPSNIFTPAKKDILLKKVLPAAMNMLSGALKVNRVVGNLVNWGCPDYTVPAWHRTTGVPNADYVLYLSAVTTSANILAWAVPCKRDSAGRAISGRANFAPMHLVWNENNPTSRRRLVRIAMHEIMHAIGFSYLSWRKYFVNGNPISTETRRGKHVAYFSSHMTVEKTRAHFDCPTANGPEIEDGEGPVNRSSHWDRRNHRDDLMASRQSSGMYLSPITLAALEDSGHYKVDWSKAENPKWMYKGGCGMYNATCNTTAGGLGTYFCNDMQRGCTWDHLSLGKCDIRIYDNLPAWAQYISGEPRKSGTSKSMDYCPLMSTVHNRRCNMPTNSASNSSIIPMYYANDGRCFVTNGVSKNGSTHSTGHANCLQTRCVNKAVQFKIPKNDLWISCPSFRASVSLSQYGYNGAVICPDPNMICDGVETTTFNAQRESATVVPSTILAVLITSVVFVCLCLRQ